MVRVGALLSNTESWFALANGRSGEEVDAGECAAGVRARLAEPFREVLGMGVVLFADRGFGGGEAAAEEDAVFGGNDFGGAELLAAAAASLAAFLKSVIETDTVEGGGEDVDLGFGERAVLVGSREERRPVVFLRDAAAGVDPGDEARPRSTLVGVGVDVGPAEVACGVDGACGVGPGVVVDPGADTASWEVEGGGDGVTALLGVVALVVVDAGSC